MDSSQFLTSVKNSIIELETSILPVKEIIKYVVVILD